MSENSGDLSLGYMMGQSEGGGGFGGFGEGLWAVIILAMLFGGGNGFGFGGGGGGISSGFAWQGIDNGIRSIQNGLCDGFHSVEMSICGLGHTINSAARDIIDNNNCNYRGIMDFLVSEKLSSKDARIAELTNQLSQSNQNAVLRAAIDASTAEIIRRTGHEYPVPAYVVANPNCCGNGYSGYNGYNGYGGCGC